MNIRVEVRSQSEFDACVKAGNIAVVIGCRVVAWDNSSVVAWDNSSVEARGNSSVVARDNSSVVAWDNSSVVAWDNSSVEARGNSSVVAWDNSSVVARGNSSVVAWDNSSVVAWDNSSVEARGNSSVVARDNSSVVAWGNVFVRLFSALKVKASALVTIVKHGEAQEISGGRQLECSPEPTTGAEWCEFNGIDSADAAYKVKNIDAKILAQIEREPSNFNMETWHGGECNEGNWCNTTHCRAGYAICLAGKAGFDLEKKYGPELAGRMIYAVSRPEMPLPDFFSGDEEALEDIRNCAAAK